MLIRADAGAHDVGLAPLGYLFPYSRIGPSQEMGFLRGRYHVGRHLGAPLGYLVQRHHVQVPIHRHRDGAGNRGSRHHQHVWWATLRLGPQNVALFHTEAVLLIDHHQPQVGKSDPVFQQCMRTHDNACRARGRRQQLASAFRGALGSGE